MFFDFIRMCNFLFAFFSICNYHSNSESSIISLTEVFNHGYNHISSYFRPHCNDSLICICRTRRFLDSLLIDDALKCSFWRVLSVTKNADSITRRKYLTQRHFIPVVNIVSRYLCSLKGKTQGKKLTACQFDCFWHKLQNI